MKRWLILFLMQFVVVHNIYGIEPIRYRINLIGNDTIVFNKLVFGFDSAATNGLDTSLGELDLPPFIPPSGFKLYGVFIFYDSIQKSNIFSYLDIKPFPLSYQDTIKFLLYVIRESGVRLRISWPTIGDEVRSAWLVDEYLGTLVQVDMKKDRFVDIKNEFLDKFYIKIVLADVNSVESIPANNTAWYDNRTSELVLKPDLQEKMYCRVYNILGDIVLETYIEGEHRIGKEILSSGIYFIELIYSNEKKEFRKVIVY